jgi:hypothetical protein
MKTLSILAFLALASCTTEGRARLETAALNAAAGAAQGYAEAGTQGLKTGAASGLAKALQTPAKQPLDVQP